MSFQIKAVNALRNRRAKLQAELEMIDRKLEIDRKQLIAEYIEDMQEFEHYARAFEVFPHDPFLSKYYPEILSQTELDKRLKEENR